MRFAHAHKACSYMLVLSAFFALALSGELGDAQVLFAFVGILVSWYWEPPRIRFESWNRLWNAVTLAAFAYTVISVLGGGDFLVLAAEFLTYLMVAKMFARRANRDYLHVYVLSFLMLVAGTVLNTEFTFGVFFLSYVVSFTWALILFHLRREMEDNFLLKHADHASSQRVHIARILNSRRIVGRGFFAGTASISLVIFAASALLFLMIPRIGFGLFFDNSRNGVAMAGFSDGVKLGGHGVIKTDKRVVMRVKVDTAYEGRKAPYVYWRGVAFDEYDNGQWRRTKQSPPSRRVVTFWNGLEQHHLLYGEPSHTHADMRSRMQRGIRQDIYLEPFGYDVLFGAAMPSTFEFKSKWGKKSPRTDRNDEIRFSHTAGVKYTVYSQTSRPAARLLRAASPDVPSGFNVYLQIPEDISQRVRELAVNITSNAHSNYDKMVALEQWLKSTLGYTLVMKSPGDLEPIEYFLFQRKKGHCEYFSSALAIMGRAVGVPTRNVNGFLGGEWNEYDNYIAVRAGDAHSWTEAYFPGAGWVTFDATPAAQVDHLGRGGGGLRARLRRFFDTLRFKWFKWVIEYDLYRQLSLFKKLKSSLSGGAKGAKSSIKRLVTAAKQHKYKLLATVVALFALLWLVSALRRKTGHAKTSAQRARHRRAVAIEYNRVLGRLAKRGYPRRAAQTPREYATSAVERKMPGCAPLTQLTELYYRVEYGEANAERLLGHAHALSKAIDVAFANHKRRDKRRADAT